MEYKEPQNRENDSETQEKEEYSFMQETIKDEAGAGKKWRNLVVRYVGLGLIFGAASCLGFYAVKPVIEEKFQGDPQEVELPEEEEEEVTQEEDIEPAEEQAPALTIEDYREMNQALYEVADTAGRSVVEITGIHSGQEWKNEAYDEKNSAAGVIVFDNGQEILIFGKSSVAEGSESLTVTFADGKVYPAELKQKEEILGFAIYSVEKSNMEESAREQIQVAVLGSSGSVGKGDGVIALGKPFGYYGSVGYGVQASVKNQVVKEDGEYGILCTDIPATENGTGILVNLQGEVVGMIDQSISDKDSMKLVTAYGISDLKDIIELLSNGKTVPYIGIKGVTVTETLAEQQKIPKGIYVQEVEVDSPAMKAGIQSGDVINCIGGESITTLDAYHEKLMKCREGQKVEITGMRQGANGYVDIEFSIIIGNKE